MLKGKKYWYNDDGDYCIELVECLFVIGRVVWIINNRKRGGGRGGRGGRRGEKYKLEKGKKIKGLS